jgi:hypothetical protein
METMIRLRKAQMTEYVSDPDSSSFSADVHLGAFPWLIDSLCIPRRKALMIHDRSGARKRDKQ